MQPVAWLFTKDQSAVRIELRTSSQGATLTISGPEAAGQVYEFSVESEAEVFRADYERQLAAEGFKLQAVSERRRRTAGDPSTTETGRRRGD